MTSIPPLASVEEVLLRGELRALSESWGPWPVSTYLNVSQAISRLLWSNQTFPPRSSGSAWSFPSLQETVAFGVTAQAVMITLYSLTTLFAVLGNGVTLVVLLRGIHLKTELKAFLVNLAVADLTMALFCMPFTFTQVLLGRWIFGGFMCPFVLFMQVLSVSVSIFTNMAIGIDRYWGVIFPLRTRLTKTRTKCVLAFIWLCAAGLAGVQLHVARLSPGSFYRPSYCNERWPSAMSRHAYTVLIAAITYILPLVILAFTYYKVAMKLWIRKTPGNVHPIRDELMMRFKWKMLKMVVTLVVVFAVCWMPLQLFNVLIDLAPHLLDNIRTPEDEQLYFGIFYSCHWVAMANSFTNPIIYGLLNDNFRLDMKRLLCPCATLRYRDDGEEGAGRSTLTLQQSFRESFRAFKKSSISSFRTSMCSTRHSDSQNGSSLARPEIDIGIQIPISSSHSYSSPAPPISRRNGIFTGLRLNLGNRRRNVCVARHSSSSQSFNMHCTSTSPAPVSPLEEDDGEVFLEARSVAGSLDTSEPHTCEYSAVVYHPKPTKFIFADIQSL